MSLLVGTLISQWMDSIKTLIWDCSPVTADVTLEFTDVTYIGFICTYTLLAVLTSNTMPCVVKSHQLSPSQCYNAL